MRRFDELEGLRGWLAWIVVGWHLVLACDLKSRFLLFQPAAGAASVAVDVFIILSGFVITHLMLDKHESYAPYLLRRALRLYPNYIVALALGLATTPACRFDPRAYTVRRL